jgi:hypothetical protein
LKCVQWTGDPHFQPAAYEAIYKATGGIPRRINAVCDRILLSGYLAGKREFTRDDVEMVAAEMHEDSIGADSAPSAEAPPAAVPDKAAAPRSRPIDPAHLHLDPKSADEASRLLAKMQTDPIEERLTRLERRADTIVALLERLLDAIKPKADAIKPQPTKKQVKP